jgi:hypothetical protein
MGKVHKPSDSECHTTMSELLDSTLYISSALLVWTLFELFLESYKETEAAYSLRCISKKRILMHIRPLKSQQTK